MDNGTILAAVCGSPVGWFICAELSKAPIGQWVKLSPTLPGSQYLKARARARLEWLGVAEFRRGWLNWIEGRYTDRAVQVYQVKTVYHCHRRDKELIKWIALPDCASPETIGQMIKRKIDRVCKWGDYRVWDLLIDQVDSDWGDCPQTPSEVC